MTIQKYFPVSEYGKHEYFKLGKLCMRKTICSILYFLAALLVGLPSRVTYFLPGRNLEVAMAHLLHKNLDFHGTPFYHISHFEHPNNSQTPHFQISLNRNTEQGRLRSPKEASWAPGKLECLWLVEGKKYCGCGVLLFFTLLSFREGYVQKVRMLPCFRAPLKALKFLGQG